MTNGVPVTTGSPPMGPYMGPIGYPPGFYSQYPPPSGPKPGEGPTYYPQFYIASLPAPPLPPSHGNQEGENQGYPPHPQFYPATFLTHYAQPYPPYMMHARTDGQMALPSPHYAAYTPTYPKPPSADSSGDVSGIRDPQMEGRNGEEGSIDKTD
jgi:hypothetical protein